MSSWLVAVPEANAAELLRCSTSRPDHDLNGGGYLDAAVGDPSATVNGQAEAGTVTVLFGDADGRIGEDSASVFAISSPDQDGGSVYVLSDEADPAPRFWKPGTDGVPGTGVHFGQAVS